MNDATPASAAEPGIGHNKPPTAEEEFQQTLGKKFGHLKERAAEIERNAKGIPAGDIPEELIGKAGDMLGLLKGHAQEIDLNRKLEKSRWQKIVGMVDGFFHAIAAPLNTLHAEIEPRHTAALNKKAAAAREAERLRAEAARIEAEKKEAAAKAELERKQEEARKAKAAADEAERIRREQAEALQRQIDADKARRAEAERVAEANRIEAERLATESLAEVTGGEPLEPGPTHAAETRTEAPAVVAEQAPPANPVAAPVSVKDRVAQAEADRIAGLNAKRASELAGQKQRELETAERHASRSTGEATAAAVKVQKVETAKSATFARTRGDLGTISTLQDFWDHGPIDRKALMKSKIDMRTIFRLIPDDQVDAAVKAYIAAHAPGEPPVIQGVKFFQNTRGHRRTS